MPTSLCLACSLPLFPIFPASARLCPARCRCLDTRQTPTKHFLYACSGYPTPHRPQPLFGNVRHVSIEKLPLCQRHGSPHLRLGSCLKSPSRCLRDTNRNPPQWSCRPNILSPTVAAIRYVSPAPISEQGCLVPSELEGLRPPLRRQQLVLAHHPQHAPQGGAHAGQPHPRPNLAVPSPWEGDSRMVARISLTSCSSV